MNRAFAVYSTEYDPRRLYATGAAETLDRSVVKRLLGIEGGSLDLLADLSEGRVLWSFRAERRTRAAREGQFVADCRAEDDLFATLAAELRGLKDTDDWSFPIDDHPRSTAGARLAEVEPVAPSRASAQLRHSLDELVTDGASGSSPVVLTMERYETALRALKTLYERGAPLTVGVCQSPPQTDLTDSGIDVLLCPTERDDSAESRLTARSDADRGSAPATATARQRAEAKTADKNELLSTGIDIRLASAVLAVVLGLSLYSFVTTKLLHPITGLAAFGGFVGGIASAPLLSNNADSAVSHHSAGTVLRAAARSLKHDPGIITVGAVLGFFFPTVVRVSGAMMLGSQWWFGPVGHVMPALLSILLYLGTLSVGAAAAARLVGISPSSRRPRELVTGVAVYAIALFVATGLAHPLWYGFIPAV